MDKQSVIPVKNKQTECPMRITFLVVLVQMACFFVKKSHFLIIMVHKEQFFFQCCRLRLVKFRHVNLF